MTSSKPLTAQILEKPSRPDNKCRGSIRRPAAEAFNLSTLRPFTTARHIHSSLAIFNAGYRRLDRYSVHVDYSWNTSDEQLIKAGHVPFGDVRNVHMYTLDFAPAHEHVQFRQKQQRGLREEGLCKPRRLHFPANQTVTASPNTPRYKLRPDILSTVDEAMP